VQVQPEVHPVNRPYLLWGALGCALVGTAHAEYTLATAAGANWFVAGAVPGALDLYVIQALRVHRDVLAAVLVMVAANVTSYLVHSGDLPVDWRLRSAVGALAPLLLWRIHYLWVQRAWDEVQDKVRAPEGAPAEPWDDGAWVRDWTNNVAPEVQTEVHAPEPAPVIEPVHPEPGAHLAAVPDLPAGFAYRDQAPTTEQFAAGRDLWRELGRRPSQREVKTACRCGQDTAKAILTGLTKEFEGATV
jgi:hypothetical protein